MYCSENKVFDVHVTVVALALWYYGALGFKGSVHLKIFFFLPLMVSNHTESFGFISLPFETYPVSASTSEQQR